MDKIERDELAVLYRRRFGELSAGRTAVWSVLNEYFARWIKKTDAVLDLGAGYCEFINGVTAAKRYALDLNPDTRRHADASVEVIEHDSVARWPLDDGALDVVFTSNFLEHLPNKNAVSETVLQARRVLKAGGLFIAMGPNIRYLPGAYWDFFDHYVPLTDLSLEELLESRGFCRERRIDKFLPYTMSRGRRYPRWIVRAYVALPLAWRLFGKQFLIVARNGEKQS